MEPQVLNEEFLKFLSTFYKPDGTAAHDNLNGQCKCGETHTPFEMQKLAVSEYQKANLE